MVKFDRAIIGGSIILLITFNIFNLLNFIFQASMARLLLPAEYRIVGVLLSVMYIAGIFSESIQNVIIKYTSQEKDGGKIKNLLKRAKKRALLLATIAFFVYLVIMVPLAYLSHIHYALLALHGLVIFGLFMLPVTRGVMQGKKLFARLGMNLIIESAIKLILGIVFVLIVARYFPALKIYAVSIAILAGVFSALFFSGIALKGIMRMKEKKIPVTFYLFADKSVSIIFITFIIILFYSVDIFIANIVFPEDLAGYYTYASLLAKSIFWGTQPISKALFPISAEKAKMKAGSTFANALALLSGLVILSLIIIYFFPGLLIRIFAGGEYQESIRALPILALGTSMLSFANLVLLYKIARGATRGYLVLGIALVVEVLLLFTYSNSLVQFSLAYMAAAAIFLWASTALLKE